MASPRDTWSLTDHLLATQEPLYKSATQHPFLLAGAEGRLPKDILSRWLANDRLYIHSYIRAAGQLLASIDLPKQVPRSQEAFETQLADWLIEALVAIRKEERFFIDVADRYDLGIDITTPFPPASQTSANTLEKLPGLVQMETIFASVAALTKSQTTQLIPWLEGALTFWGTERCYLDAWSWARDKAEERRASGGQVDKEDADGGALRKEFIPNWSSPEFAQFVVRLGKLIDDAVASVLEGREAEEREKLKGEILARVEGKWKSLLEAERQFWPEL
ncbi:heme oxygenase-like protein [Parathielavia appendiculata]|uniref:Heme oxygenase-like protein n=1 Tax=Parathielavia appendiculata TaxID=2587402 RepID=A0AAN6U4I3_9PEZI|nr:heme oxygenase-like protein [Parathielavia appendiculata]